MIVRRVRSDEKATGVGATQISALMKGVGHPTWYGERFDLKAPSTWGKVDLVEETTCTTRKGRVLRVHLEGWQNLLMSGKRDLPMHQCPFTLIRVRVLDEHGCPVFKHTPWLMVIGKRRNELSLAEAWEAYGQR